MKWLFWQMWVLLLLSFLLGAFVTWVVFVKLRRPAGSTGTAAAPAGSATGAVSAVPAVSAAPAALATPAVSAAPAALATPAAETTAGVDDPAAAEVPAAPDAPDASDSPVAIAAAEPTAPADGVVAAEVPEVSVPPAASDAAGGKDASDEAEPAEPADATELPQEAVAERPGVPEPAVAEPAAATVDVEPAAATVDLDTPVMGIPVIRLDAARAPADQLDDDGFDGNADDTVVIDADVAAGRSMNGRAASVPAVAAAPYPRGALPLADGGAPAPGFLVKGEADPMLYHGPASPAYQQTRADVWFRDEEDAEDAGFRPWNWRARVTGGLPKLDANGMPVAGSKVDPADAAALAALIATTPAPDAPQETVGPSPYGEGSALPGPGGSAPSPEYRIKGNGDSMLYHASDSPYFDRTRPQVWFRTEDDAKRAGFSPWNRRVRQNDRLLAKPAFEEGPYPGSAKPGNDGGPPTAEFVVKGSEDAKLYHTPFSRFFDVTVADVWFRSEADAQRAGFAAWHTADTAAHTPDR